MINWKTILECINSRYKDGLFISINGCSTRLFGGPAEEAGSQQPDHNSLSKLYVVFLF